ncbi:MAG: hypothetical protein WD894_17825 [Pirellulales bacterium]
MSAGASIIRLLVGSVIISSAIGCGQDPHRLAPVSGAVTLDSKPLAGALVSYLPVAKPGTMPAVTSRGITDDQGNYTLTTSDDRPGAVVGRHIVRIKTSRAPGDGSTEVLEGQTVTQAPERVPAKYNLRTELSFDVPEEGADQANFQLQSR